MLLKIKWSIFLLYNFSGTKILKKVQKKTEKYVDKTNTFYVHTKHGDNVFKNSH